MGNRQVVPVNALRSIENATPPVTVEEVYDQGWWNGASVVLACEAGVITLSVVVLGLYLVISGGKF